MTRMSDSGPMESFIKVALVSEIPPGTGKTVEIQGRKVAVFNVGGKFYAVDDTCAHRGGPLGEGSLEGSTVTCPWHGWQYDVATGRCVSQPQARVASYAVKVEGSDVWVALT